MAPPSGRPAGPACAGGASWATPSGRGGEMVDAGDLKSPGSNPMWVRAPPPALLFSHLKGGGSRTHGACLRLHVGGAAALVGLRSLLTSSSPTPGTLVLPPQGWRVSNPRRLPAPPGGWSCGPGGPPLTPVGVRAPPPALLFSHLKGGGSRTHGACPFGIPFPASPAPSSPSAFWNRLHPRIIGAVSRCCAPAATAAGPHPAPPEMHPYGRSTRPLEFQPGFRSRRHR